MFTSLFKKVLIFLILIVLLFAILFTFISRHYNYRKFSEHITRMIYLEMRNLPDKSDQKRLLDELSIKPSFILNENKDKLWGYDSFHTIIPQYVYEKAYFEGYAVYYSPAGEKTSADYGIIWLEDTDIYLLFQLPSITPGYIDLFITPVFLSWSLLFILVSIVTWYIIYDRSFFREILKLRTSLQYLSTGLYHEKLPRMNTNEFRTVNKDLLSLQSHISALIGKYQYQEKAAFLGEINAKLSHQVRNSLSGIQSALSLIEKQVTEKKSMDLLMQVKEEVRALQYQAENLLNYIRPFQVKKTRADLIEWVKSWINKNADDIPVSIEAPQKPLFIMFDQLAMRQVLENLFRNSREARSSGLEINLLIQATVQGVVIKVLDNGPGFEENILKAIIPSSTKEGGSGLGLFITRKIIEAHCGSLTLRNRNIGTGAEIHIFLPGENNSVQ